MPVTLRLGFERGSFSNDLHVPTSTWPSTPTPTRTPQPATAPLPVPPAHVITMSPPPMGSTQTLLTSTSTIESPLDPSVLA